MVVFSLLFTCPGSPQSQPCQPPDVPRVEHADLARSSAAYIAYQLAGLSDGEKYDRGIATEYAGATAESVACSKIRLIYPQPTSEGA